MFREYIRQFNELVVQIETARKEASALGISGDQRRYVEENTRTGRNLDATQTVFLTPFRPRFRTTTRPGPSPPKQTRGLKMLPAW
jgi:hypothetical protein